MTRRSVYSAALLVFLAASALTLASIIIPRWISWDSQTASGTRIHYTYGLHKRCSSLTHGCTHFPEDEDCHGGDRYFCSMWRSVGFLMSFAIVMEGVTFIAFVVLISSGQQKRQAGWRIISAMVLFVGLIQCASMSLMAYLYENDDRFFPGWRLDTSWILCTISWSVMVLTAACISVSAFLMSPEGGYELIPGEG
ncbi:hypothetical protein MMC13_003726 [Lambiella insularis]|nr:hypothetical protein [Lambiella insularis]